MVSEGCPARRGCSKIGEFRPGACPSTCCWLSRCFQFSICQLEAKGWAKSPQAVLHPRPCYSTSGSPSRDLSLPAAGAARGGPGWA